MAAEGFHCFPETADPSAARLHLQITGLPPAAPLSALKGAGRKSRAPAEEPSTATPLPPYPTEKHFAAAALESIVLLDVFPALFNKYATDSFFAQLTLDTIKQNLQTGFTYDHDLFPTNQSSHPNQGAMYFNAARTNGYSFWESAPFVLGAAFLWEMFGESQPPALNDVVQTTLGGMAWGESQFRISNMLLDNTKSGFERFLREAGGFVVNPLGGLNRLLRGEMAKDFQNPPDRFPSRLYVELDGGYRHRSISAGENPAGQGVFSTLLRYGDPFDGEIAHPFEVFDLDLQLSAPAEALLTGLTINGMLKEWKLSGSPSSGQRFGFFLRYDYVNNNPQVLAAEAFGASHLWLVPVGGGIDLRTEASVMGIPLAGFGVDYPEAGVASTVGRDYDYGPGLGARASARLRRHEVDLLAVEWTLVGLSTSDGISRASRLQTLSAEARLPVTSSLILGGGWSWGERLNTYDAFPTVRLAGTSWRVFGGWAFSSTPRPSDRAPEAPAASPAAELTERWDLSAFGGGFFGTRVYTGVDRSVLMKDAPVWGLRAGYRLTPVFGIEASWSHADTKLEAIDPPSGAPTGASTPVAVDSLELDGLFGFGGPRCRGYVGLGAGAQQIRPTVPTLDASGTTTRFSANIAIGFLYFVSPRLALRIDGRYRWRIANERIGAVEGNGTYDCEPEPIGCKPFATDVFSTGEVTGGLTYRF